MNCRIPKTQRELNDRMKMYDINGITIKCDEHDLYRVIDVINEFKKEGFKTYAADCTAPYGTKVVACYGFQYDGFLEDYETPLHYLRYIMTDRLYGGCFCKTYNLEEHWYDHGNDPVADNSWVDEAWRQELIEYNQKYHIVGVYVDHNHFIFGDGKEYFSTVDGMKYHDFGTKEEFLEKAMAKLLETVPKDGAPEEWDFVAVGK